MTDEAVRTCPRCDLEQQIEAFAVDRSKSSGRKAHCKRCDAQRHRTYYVEHAVRERRSAKRKPQPTEENRP